MAGDTKLFPPMVALRLYCSKEFSSQGSPKEASCFPALTRAICCVLATTLAFLSFIFSSLTFCPLPTSESWGYHSLWLKLNFTKANGELPTKGDREGATLEHSTIYQISMIYGPGSSLRTPHQGLISQKLTLETAAPKTL